MLFLSLTVLTTLQSLGGDVFAEWTLHFTGRPQQEHDIYFVVVSIFLCCPIIGDHEKKIVNLSNQVLWRLEATNTWECIRTFLRVSWHQGWSSLRYLFLEANLVFQGRIPPSNYQSGCLFEVNCQENKIVQWPFWRLWRKVG